MQFHYQQFYLCSAFIIDEIQNEHLTEIQKDIISSVQDDLDQVEKELSNYQTLKAENEEIFHKIKDIRKDDSDLNNAETTLLDTLIDLISSIKRSDDINFETAKNTLESLIVTLDSIKISETVVEDPKIEEKELSDNGEKVEKLKTLEMNCDKLMNNLKHIHDIFESTDGYTTDEEEDEAYYQITKSLKSQMEQLSAIQLKIKEYNDTSDFDDVDTFEHQMQAEIDQISESLQTHKNVLEKIDWVAKLGRRNHEFSEAQKELDEIIADGDILLTDVTKLHDRSIKATEENKELSEKFKKHVETVTESLSTLNALKAEFDPISELISEFEESIMVREDQDFEFITNLMAKNKASIPFNSNHFSKSKKKSFT